MSKYLMIRLREVKHIILEMRQEHYVDVQSMIADNYLSYACSNDDQVKHYFVICS